MQPTIVVLPTEKNIREQGQEMARMTAELHWDCYQALREAGFKDMQAYSLMLRIMDHE